MKFKIKVAEFSKGLNTVKRVARRTDKVITENGLLVCSEDSLTILTTDLEKSLIYKFNSVEVIKSGSIVIPVKMMAELVDTLADEDTVECGIKGNKFILSYNDNRNSSSFITIDPEAFPEVGLIEANDYVTIQADELKSMITRCLVAVNLDDARPILTFSEWKLLDEEIQVTASDGHRIHRELLGIKLSDNNHDDWSALIPASSLVELRNVLNGDVVRCSVKDNKVSFSIGNHLTFITNTGGFNYPDLTRAISNQFTLEVSLEPKELIRVLKRAAIYNKNSDGSTLMMIDGNKAKFSAIGNEVGETENELDLDKDYGQFEIAFNNQYLLDIVNQLSGKFILQLTDVLKPFQVMQENFVHVIMAMHRTDIEEKSKAKDKVTYE